MTRKRIYLSGPITGIKNYLLNFLRAENTIRAHKKFKRCDVINPARLGNVLPYGTHKEYMELCYALVGMSDKMVMLKGWQRSKGAKLEKKMAEEMDMEIYELQENGELKPLFKNEYICKGNEIKYYA